MCTHTHTHTHTYTHTHTHTHICNFCMHLIAMMIIETCNTTTVTVTHHYDDPSPLSQRNLHYHTTSLHHTTPHHHTTPPGLNAPYTFLPATTCMKPHPLQCAYTLYVTADPNRLDLSNERYDKRTFVHLGETFGNIL